VKKQHQQKVKTLTPSPLRGLTRRGEGICSSQIIPSTHCCLPIPYFTPTSQIPLQEIHLSSFTFNFVGPEGKKRFSNPCISFQSLVPPQITSNVRINW